MQRAITNDVRVRRNYPDQPPVIPHAIEGYALDLNANKCMSCHARRFTEQSQAPMISVTHYQDREGNTLGGLAPRRYACLACHVPQTEARPLVENRFQDMDALTEPERQPAAGATADVDSGCHRRDSWAGAASGPNQACLALVQKSS